MENFSFQIKQNPFPLFFASRRNFLVSQPQCDQIPRIIKIQKPIRCARNKRARSGRLMLESAYSIASKLMIIPEPFDIILKEFVVGGGNGVGSGFGFGFELGKRKRRKSNRRRQMDWLEGISVIARLVMWLIGFGVLFRVLFYVGS